MYTELLEICGFEPQEIQSEMPRLEKTFKILGIDAADAKRSVEHIRQYQDNELVGVRKMRSVALRELANLVLAREENKKIVYFTPTIIGGLEAFMLATNTSSDVYCQSPDLLLWMALGGVLGAWHLTPFLEAAEETGLRAGQAHCGAFQFKIGAIAKGVIPKPDLFFTIGGLTCAQAGQADTLASELFNVPVAYVDSTDYPEHDVWPEISSRHVQYAAETVRRASKQFEQVTGLVMTDDARKDGLVGAAKTLRPLIGVADLLKTDPVPIGFHELGLSYYLGALPMRKGNRERAIQAATLIAQEVEQRVKEGKGIAPKGTPRVFFSYPPLSDDTVMAMINAAGMVIGAGGGMNLTDVEKTKPTIATWEERNIESVYRKAYWHNASGVGPAYAEICRKYNVDGAILMNTVCCRLFNPCTPLQKEHLEKELGIPILALEGDIYDSRNYSAERLRSRIETFAEIVKSAKAAKN